MNNKDALQSCDVLASARRRQITVSAVIFIVHCRQREIATPPLTGGPTIHNGPLVVLTCYTADTSTSTYVVPRCVLQSQDTTRPRLVACADMASAQTREMSDANWLYVRPTISPYQRYRLVLGTLGRPLAMFRCSRELTTGVLYAMKGMFAASIFPAEYH